MTPYAMQYFGMRRFLCAKEKRCHFEIPLAAWLSEGTPTSASLVSLAFLGRARPNALDITPAVGCADLEIQAL